MHANNFLHLYLNRSPSEFEIRSLLTLYGFKFLRTDSHSDSKEPSGFHWVWKNLPLSDGGFKLVFYHRLFPDDSHFGKFNAFAILAGDHTSSDMDLNAVDLFSHLLLKRYGGMVHNPEGEATNSYLSGIIQPAKLAKPNQV